MNTNLELNLKVNYLRTLWKEFCEAHTKLYEVTCDEYLHLMSSDMDELEISVESKGKIIELIDNLDRHRKETIKDISGMLNIEVPKNISELLSNNDIDPMAKEEVEKLNLVLLDIIEKIIDQNKKNQFFLNKAIHSLKELKDSFSGKTNYNTYSAAGVARNNNTY